MDKQHKKVLLLSQSYQPIKAITWERAFCLFMINKAEIISYYDNWFINTVSKSFSVPSVIRLLSKTQFKSSKIKFSRSNIYKRDSYRCLYCGNKFKEDDLTMDHVIPRSLGGRTTWINIVSSCFPCNSKKSNRTPQQAQMKLIEQPRYPGNFMGENFIRFFIDEVPDDWKMWVVSR